MGAHHGVLGDGNRDLVCPPAVALVSHIRENDDPETVERLVEMTRDQCGLPPDDIVNLLKTSYTAAEELAHLFADG